MGLGAEGGTGPGEGGFGGGGAGDVSGGEYGGGFEPYASDFNQQSGRWGGSDLPSVSEAQENVNQVVKSQQSNSILTTVKSAVVLALEALVALTPLGAVLQAGSLMASKKGIVTNISDMIMAYMAENPNGNISDAMANALDRSGLSDQMGPADREAIINGASEHLSGIENIAKTETFQEEASKFVEPEMPERETWSEDKYVPGDTWSEKRSWEYSLTPEEKSMFNAIETAEIGRLTNQINENTKDLAETRIAELIDKGIWDGNIGKDALVQVYEDANDAIAQGSLGIQSASMQSQVSFLQNKYNIGKELENSATQREFSSAENEAQRAFFAGENAEQRGFQDWQTKTAEEWQNFRDSTNRSWQTSESDVARKWQSLEASRDRSAQMDLSDKRQDALDDANKWNAFGNVIPPLIQSTVGSEGFDWSKLF